MSNETQSCLTGNLILEEYFSSQQNLMKLPFYENRFWKFSSSIKIKFSYFMYQFITLLSVDCQDPTCSGHGFCVSGSCVCKKGWRGQNCGRVDNNAKQCLPDCSGNGEFDVEKQTCNCYKRFTGEDCSKGKNLATIEHVI